ncbi:hypothetical protein [Aurantimonas sp. 22II-16-19i]|uniref:hypothetical protein n=1 Tax=Aurantimonas sp. 22II-16-19i TaxID=1317114 RepID=UPI0009F7D108|nr:hypothetical protein [Aurantimonas sp. 22II-16-19i]ORE90984.1 hypothetical protein ATO4_20019 [Aurantimonas sp. 22II-16-19i]
MKRIKIEDLLAWAYRQELPKAGWSGRQGPVMASPCFAGLATLGTHIDASNGFGLFPDLSADAEPHPDAIAVDKVVRSFRDAWFEAPEGYDVLGDVVPVGDEPMTDDERAEAHARGLAMVPIMLQGRMPGTLIRHALLGSVPEWRRPDIVQRKTVRNAQGGAAWFRKVWRAAGEGRPEIAIEIDGFDRVRRRPHPAAYRKTVFAPDLAGLVADRIAYQAYVISLAALAGDLDGRLAEHGVDGPGLRLWPWEAEGERDGAAVEFGGKPEGVSSAGRDAA